MSVKPHSKDWDIFRAGGYTYIIRNDLGNGAPYCMRFEGSAGEKGNPIVFRATNLLFGGDHYLGRTAKGNTNYKYVIKDNKYARVHDAEKGTDYSELIDLHSDFKNKDHFCQTSNKFMAFDLKKGKYYTSEKLTKKPKEHSLHSDILKLTPICIWANNDYFYFLNENKKEGLTVKYTKHIGDKDTIKFTTKAITPAVQNFMPGGLGMTEGYAKLRWNLLGQYVNGDAPSNHEQMIEYYYGTSRTLGMTDETHWAEKVKFTGEAKISEIYKAEISSETEFGGSHIKTSTQAWTEYRMERQTIKTDLKPHEEISFYNAVISNDKGEILSGKTIVTTNNGKPPNETALKNYNWG